MNNKQLYKKLKVFWDCMDTHMVDNKFTNEERLKAFSLFASTLVYSVLKKSKGLKGQIIQALLNSIDEGVKTAEFLIKDEMADKND